MNYALEFTDTALSDLSLLKRNEPAAYKKALKLIDELKEHPTTGTGKPERLRGDLSGQWSQRINARHRLIYTIHDDILTVLILASSSHYGDK